MNHLEALGKKFDTKKLNIKNMKNLNKTWHPKATTIFESRDLTSINMTTLFAKIREHELELGKLKDDEKEGNEKNNIALKVNSRKEGCKINKRKMLILIMKI